MQSKEEQDFTELTINAVVILMEAEDLTLFESIESVSDSLGLCEEDVEYLEEEILLRSKDN